jgi:hypothetical protein
MHDMPNSAYLLSFKLDLRSESHPPPIASVHLPWQGDGPTRKFTESSHIPLFHLGKTQSTTSSKQSIHVVHKSWAVNIKPEHTSLGNGA